MKAKKIIATIFTVLAVAMASFSGIMKLMGSEEVVTGMEKVGVKDQLVMLGLMEIVFSILFIFRPTMKIGFILLTCYFAGAIAVELSRQMPFNAVLPLALVWIAAFLRDSSIFLPVKKVPTT